MTYTIKCEEPTCTRTDELQRCQRCQAIRCPAHFAIVRDGRIRKLLCSTLTSRRVCYQTSLPFGRGNYDV